MLYIKLMADEQKSDLCLFKNYTMITIGPKDTFQFGEWGPAIPNEYAENYAEKFAGGNLEVLLVKRENETVETYPITGNAYIMNEGGKTISTRTKTPADYTP